MIFNACVPKSPDTEQVITIEFSDEFAVAETRVYDCNGRDTIENSPYVILDNTPSALYAWMLQDENDEYVGTWGWEEGAEHVLQDLPNVECGGRYTAGPLPNM